MKNQVIIWTELFFPNIGGVEVFAKQLINSLRKRTYDFVVITSASELVGSGVDFQDGIKIFRFPFHRLIMEQDLKTIYLVSEHIVSIFNEINPMLLHLNSIQPSIFFYYLIKNKISIPSILTLHSPIHSQTHNSLAGRIIKSADWVVGNSKHTLDKARTLIPQITTHSSLIYNGLKMPSFPFKPLSFSPPTLLCIGRIVKEKGFDLVIEVLCKILEIFPETRLVIAGDGLAKNDLQEQVMELGLGGKIRFKGWVRPEEIPLLIDEATLVIIPSRWEEPFGLVALQAAQRRRPVIASRTGGLKEIIIHNVTGLHFEVENKQELAQHILFLLGHPQVAITMGKNAHRRAKKIFNLKMMIDGYDSLYQKLLK